MEACRYGSCTNRMPNSCMWRVGRKDPRSDRTNNVPSMVDRIPNTYTEIDDESE